jgi:hypothetical protein
MASKLVAQAYEPVVVTSSDGSEKWVEMLPKKACSKAVKGESLWQGSLKPNENAQKPV